MLRHFETLDLYNNKRSKYNNIFLSNQVYANVKFIKEPVHAKLQQDHEVMLIDQYKVYHESHPVHLPTLSYPILHPLNHIIYIYQLQ